MIAELLQVLAPSITELPFVHKYGGLARKVSRQIAVNPEETIFRTETYPVSPTVSHKHCWEEGRYLELVPDEAYSSIFYFEDVNGMDFKGYEDISGRHFLKFAGRVRLVGWLNLPALGISDTEKKGFFTVSLINAINKQFVNITSPWKVHRLRFVVSKDESRSRNPFSEYGWTDREVQGRLMHPFDFINILVNVEAVFSPRCFAGVQLGPALDCIDYSGSEPVANESFNVCGSRTLSISRDGSMLTADLAPNPEQDVEYLWFFDVEGTEYEQISSGKSLDIQGNGFYKVTARWGLGCETSNIIEIND